MLSFSQNLTGKGRDHSTFYMRVFIETRVMHSHLATAGAQKKQRVDVRPIPRTVPKPKP